MLVCLTTYVKVIQLYTKGIRQNFFPMLEKLFSSKTRIRLLTVFLLRGDGRFYLRELVKKTGAQLRSVQVELANLTEAGILIKEISGRQTYYRIDKRCPIIPELRSIFIKTAGLSDVLRTALAPLADSIDVAFVFGSFATDRVRPDSDVDLMIVGRVTLQEIVDVLGSVEQEIGREVNPSVFPLEEFRERVEAGEHFIISVLNERKLFLIGDERELERDAGRGQA